MMRKLFFSLFFFWIVQAQADVTISDGNLSIQNVTKPELYVFCSKKQTTLILDRINFKRSASTGWSTELAPFTCTIFFTDHSPFVFSCNQKSPDAWHLVDCSQYILASRFPWEGALLSGDMPTGAYWVAENIAADDVPMVLRHEQFRI